MTAQSIVAPTAPKTSAIGMPPFRRHITVKLILSFLPVNGTQPGWARSLSARSARLGTTAVAPALLSSRRASGVVA